MKGFGKVKLNNKGPTELILATNKKPVFNDNNTDSMSALRLRCNRNHSAHTVNMDGSTSDVAVA